MPVCGLPLQICGSLVNGGHGGNTEIRWARYATHSHLDPNKETKWLLVKTTRRSGEPECTLQQQYIAAGGIGPECHAGCVGTSGKGYVVLDAVLSRSAFPFRTASDIGSTLQEWQALKMSDQAKYKQKLRTLMMKLLILIQIKLRTGIINLNQNQGNVLVQQFANEGHYILNQIDMDLHNGAKYFAGGVVPDPIRNFAGLAALSLTFCPVNGFDRHPDRSFVLTPWCEDAKSEAANALVSAQEWKW